MSWFGAKVMMNKLTYKSIKPKKRKLKEISSPLAPKYRSASVSLSVIVTGYYHQEMF